MILRICELFSKVQQYPEVGAEGVLCGLQVEDRFNQRDGERLPFDREKVGFYRLVESDGKEQEDPVDSLFHREVFLQEGAEHGDGCKNQSGEK